MLLDAATRARDGRGGRAGGPRGCGYVGAGTVEFIVAGSDPAAYFFMEMNTRLQVEHPVTELVTGLDLVELQLRVAAGEPLPFDQEDITLTGHAVEARVYAEDPAGRAASCRPAARSSPLREPRRAAACGPTPGSSAGAEVGSRYDPMLAKVIAYGAGPRDRRCARLRRGAGRHGRPGRDHQHRLPAPAARPPGGSRRRARHRPGRAGGWPPWSPAPCPPEVYAAAAAVRLGGAGRRSRHAGGGGTRSSVADGWRLGGVDVPARPSRLRVPGQRAGARRGRAGQASAPRTASRSPSTARPCTPSTRRRGDWLGRDGGRLARSRTHDPGRPAAARRGAARRGGAGRR